MKPLIRCKEWTKLSYGPTGRLRGLDDIACILQAWKRETRSDPGPYFDVTPSSITPKFWSGTLETSKFRLEVAPMGADALSEEQFTRLDSNLTAMLAYASSSNSVSSGATLLSYHGNRHEALISAFCQELQLARRKLVLRRYVTKQESLNAPRGRIAFPRQCYESIRRPGMIASEWVALTEDIAENRIFKAVLNLYRPRCSAAIRAKIDACAAELDSVALSNDIANEWTRVRRDRLPDYYLALLKLSEALIDERGSGTLSGDTLAVGEIIFTSRLFEKFISKEVAAVVSAKGLVTNAQSRGTFLCQDNANTGIFELIPDMRVVDSLGCTKMILDAKWKELDHSSKNRGVKREDIYQLLTYGSKYGCKKLYLIYPDVSVKSGAAGHCEKFSAKLGSNVYEIAIVRVPMLGTSLGAASKLLDQVLMD